MDNKHLYLEQSSVDNSLYTQLQHNTLGELQRLSKNIWTNYNAHDPGITTNDIANYVLTEMDYKLDFGTIDYLTRNQKPFNPENYGMYLAEKVYPTIPITVEDYRRLLFLEFPNLENIKITNDNMGNYNIEIELSPFDNESNDIAQKIRTFYHANRNLCENLKNVSIYTAQQLFLHTELEIYQGEDATSILAEIYFRIMSYLSGNIDIENVEKRTFDNISWEEWLEGPTGLNRVIIPQQKNTMFELYKILMQITGIKAFKTCYLAKKNGKKEDFITDLSKGYSLFIPKSPSDIKVKIRIDSVDMSIDIIRFLEELQALYYLNNSNKRKRISLSNEESRAFIPQGTYRNVYEHSPMINDFPLCYKAENNPSLKVNSNRNMIKNKSFKNYLRLFDLIINRGLTELKGIKDLLSVDQMQVLSKMEVLSPSIYPQIKDSDRYKNVFKIKNGYLDFLDHLYGVESAPKWISEFYYWGQTDDDFIKGRINFIRNIPSLTQTRSKAWNIYGKRSIQNIPTIKAHLSLLLGLNMDENISVGNILPSHNLILMETDGKNPVHDQLSSMLIEEKMLDPSNIEPVEMESTTYSEHDELIQYEELRQIFPFFNATIINAGLFRGGINIENYKSVCLDNQAGYLLAFFNKENNKWLSLGRFDDKNNLKKYANILRKYLLQLNRQCEVVYVIEENLFFPTNPFTISFIFVNWTARFKSTRFKNICTRLIKSLLPAHIYAKTYWLGVSEMQQFEDAYRKWCDALYHNYSENDLREYQLEITNVLNKLLQE